MARKRTYEAPDMAAFMKRTAKAMARRAAEGDLEALAAMREVQVALTEALAAGAAGAHEFGYSWTEVGREMGISRQAARQQFGQKVTA